MPLAALGGLAATGVTFATGRNDAPPPAPLAAAPFRAAGDAAPAPAGQGTVAPDAALEDPDLAPPERPGLRVIDRDGDGLPDAGGTSEAGARITLTDPAGHTYTVMAGADGVYALELGAASYLLAGSYSAFAADASGNAGPSAETVVSDIVSPTASMLSVADTRGLGKPNVTGMASAGATLTITDPSGQTWSNVAQADGRYELEIPRPDPATGIYRISAADDAGNISAEASFEVTDLTAPGISLLAVSDLPGNGRVTATGSADAGSLVILTDPAGNTWSTVAQADGQYALEIPMPDPPSGLYQASASDPAGNTSAAATLEVTGLVLPVVTQMPAALSSADPELPAGEEILALLFDQQDHVGAQPATRLFDSGETSHPAAGIDLGQEAWKLCAPPVLG